MLSLLVQLLKQGLACRCKWRIISHKKSHNLAKSEDYKANLTAATQGFSKTNLTALCEVFHNKEDADLQRALSYLVMSKVNW